MPHPNDAHAAARPDPARDSLAPSRRGGVPRAIGRSPGRRYPYGLLVGTIALLAFLFLSPASFGLPYQVGAGVPGAPRGVAGHFLTEATSIPAAATAPPSYELPGSHPSMLQSIDAPSLVGQQFARQASHPINTSSILASLHPSSSVAPAQPAPAAGSNGCPVTTFVGTVRNYTGAALSGVLVQAYSVNQCICPQSACPAVTTNSTGGFTVKGPVGADYITFTISWYLDNLTYVTGVQGITDYLPYTIYLVQEAVVVGTVEANTSSHSAIAGVQVKALSRDLKLVGNPGTLTASNGYFKIGVPPVPSQVSFSPPYGFIPTFADVNATPGQLVNLGVIYLLKEPLITVTLYDAVTGHAVPSGGCSAFDTSHCHAMWVCSSITNSCLNQGPSIGTATISALGPLGYDYVKLEAVGYVENQFPIGLVTKGPYNVGRVDMVPLGAVALSVQVTHNSSAYTLPTGLWVATVCGMNGLSAGFGVVNPATFTVNMSSSKCLGGGCAPVGKSFVGMGAFPLRNDVIIVPDTNANCAPTPTWPIPNFLPVWGNETYLNVTPDTLTTSYLNFTPGTYVYGNVTVQGKSAPPVGGFTAVGFSTDNPTLTAYGFNSLVSPWACSPYPHTPTAFCVPVPPGPGKIQIQSLTQSYAQNYTWGSTPYMCCYRPVMPEPLNRYTESPAPAGFSVPVQGVTTINLTAEGGVYGRVLRGGTNLGVFFGSIQVTPAGTNPNQPTFNGPIFINGSFWEQAAHGWVTVTASASGYASNSVWAYITGNDTIGNISLTPLASITGQVRDPTGHGVYDANVEYCSAVNPTTCSVLGAGLSTSDGQFNGTVIGGWLPWTTYLIKVSASGYTSDWTWANATAGQTTTLSPVTLYPLGTNTSAAPRPHAGAGTGGAAGVWIDGYLRDAVLNWGIITSSISACPTSGLSCTQFNLTNSDGYFNDSVPAGGYNLVATPQGYSPISVFFNASQAAFVHIGNIFATELPWVNGLVNITPFGNITVHVSGGSGKPIGLAPGATAFACNANGSVCGTPLVISSQGRFAIQTGGGVYNRVQVTPNGATVATSSNGGFRTNTTIFNATTNLTNLSAPCQLEIYTMVAGYVYDNSSVGPGGVRPWLPARWVPVSVATLGPSHVSATWTTNGGGWYLFFVAPGPNVTLAAAGGSPEADIARNITVNQLLLSTNVPNVVPLPTMNLTHFGWVVARISASPNGSAAAFVGVTATYADPLNGTLTGLAATNGGGYVNVSAPPGHPVQIQVGPGADLNGTNFSVWVNSTATTFVNGTQFWGMGNESVNPWGWIRSLAVNNTMDPDLPSVVDAVNGLPVPLASVTVMSNDPGLTGSGASSNWNGQFLADAPISLRDSLVVTRSAYLNNVSTYSIRPGETAIAPTINLTGVGFLAGTVVAYPSGLPVPFAAIQACPYNSSGQSGCFNAVTNATGVFWVAATPGIVQVSAIAIGFVPNTATVARSCSDCWNWLQPIQLEQFSYVIGTVRGLPSGLPLNNSTVAACSPLGHPVGACGFTAVTPITGSFTLAVPAGQYILQANHTGYNSTYLPIGLVPGEVLPVGILFLKQFGTIDGQVLSSANLLPVPGAQVIACAAWSSGTCAPGVPTNTLGQFTISAAPGPYTITVLASGYADSYSSALFRAGRTLAIPPILINPLGSDTSFVVSGHVVNASDPSQGIEGAIVAALVNSTPVFSTRTGVAGAFAMPVLYGAYTLQVTAGGYRPTSQALVVHGVTTGLLLALVLMTYNVTGTVTDGLTHQLLNGVAITEDGIVAAVTDVNGQYLLALTNGTHRLFAAYEGGGIATYGNLPFTVSINGANLVHDFALFPPTILVRGFVVDAFAGTPLPGAAITIRGMTTDGVPVTQTLVADPSGNFTSTLPLGSYNASGSFTGYRPSTVAFEVTSAGAPVPLLLTPSNSPSGSPPAPSGLPALLTLVGALAVILVGLGVLAMLVTRRTRRGRTPTAGARRAPAGRLPPGKPTAKRPGPNGPKGAP